MPFSSQWEGVVFNSSRRAHSFFTDGFTVSMTQTQYVIKSFVMGYHDYQKHWKPKENEILECEMEPSKQHTLRVETNISHRSMRH